LDPNEEEPTTPLERCPYIRHQGELRTILQAFLKQKKYVPSPLAGYPAISPGGKRNVNGEEKREKYERKRKKGEHKREIEVKRVKQRQN
jgi:hypothetical protein